ncbi:hypothetical protein [uncultured Corynebacterium sp.]|uniref:hypothetical protein n=1 Tax=uncultured Corynebacterium sp. TaxID=159447 RepID=UPI0025D4AEE3|nr:hypothetical protein [uncultured Corynebacterium sp.]
MRKVFGGTVAAFATSISMVALSGCSVSLVDAQSSSDRATVGDRAEKSDGAGMANGGQPHDPKGDDGPRGSSSGSGAGAGEGADSSKEKSFGESGANNKGTPAGEGARPAGHEGLWFDSEPEDPWDKYVWKSQKYIGKGGEIPKLGPGTADKAFWGLPDLCSKKMQQRMKDVGFEFRKRGIGNASNPTCYWTYSTSDLDLNLQTVVLMRTVTRNGFTPLTNRGIAWDQSIYEIVENKAHLPDFQCAGQRRIGGGSWLTILVADMETTVAIRQACDRSRKAVQIIENLMN